MITHERLDAPAPLPEIGALAAQTGVPFYHKSQGLAQMEAERVLAMYPDRIAHVKTEFEPYNGWVVVLFSSTPHDLDLLSANYEIRDGVKRPKPDFKKGPIPLEQPKKAGTQSTGVAKSDGAPIKGATARVWGIADASLAKLGRVDRATIIADCEAVGINPATAATQYSKWKRTKVL